MDKETLIKELRFCTKLWEEKGGCEFGDNTKCENCATPYLLLKLITGEILHEKLTLKDWQTKLTRL